MEWVKTTAKTLPEAIDLALDNLGVDESEAEIVVLEEPRPGLFGRVRGTARVEARVKPKPIRPKNDRNRGRRRSADDGRDGDRNRNRNRNRKRQGGGDRSGGKPRSSDRADGQRTGQGGAPDGGQRDRDGGRSGSGSGGRRRGGGRGDGRGDQGRSRGDQGRSRGDQGRGRGDQRDGRPKQTTSNGARRSADDDRGRQRSGGGETRADAEASQGAAVEDVATHLRTFLTDLTEAFGLDGGVSIDDSEDGTLVGQIEGRHGLLVGPKGRTLDAVQELARISCQRSTPSSIRIKVDVGGYRRQRAAALGDFAVKAAVKAVADGVEVALEPMSPADRKSVHDALNGHDRVETRSVGSEPRRRVVVVPLDVDDDDMVEVDPENMVEVDPENMVEVDPRDAVEVDLDDGLVEVEDSVGSGAGEEE